MGRPENFRRPASEVQGRVIDDLLHDKERSGLADAVQSDQLVTVNAIEIRHIPHPNLQKVVEVPGHARRPGRHAARGLRADLRRREKSPVAVQGSNCRRGLHARARKEPAGRGHSAQRAGDAEELGCCHNYRPAGRDCWVAV